MSSKELCSSTSKSARIAATRAVPVKPKEDERHYDQQLVSESSGMADADKSLDAQNEKSSILVLNDDCLLEILSYLELKDLVAIKDCCSRFRYLADSMAGKKFPKDEYVYVPFIWSGWKVKTTEAAALKMKFPQAITHLHFRQNYLNSDSNCTVKLGTLSMITNCTSLKCLKLEMNLYQLPVQKLESILQDIETLVLTYCFGENNIRKTLAILATTRKLKHFTLRGEKNAKVPSALFDAIIKYGTNCESIRLLGYTLLSMKNDQFFAFLNQLKQLKKLRCLELRSSHRQSITKLEINLLATLDSLEELILDGCTPTDELFQSFNLNKTLKVVDLITYRPITDAMISHATDFNITDGCNTRISYSEYFPSKSSITMTRKN